MKPRTTGFGQTGITLTELTVAIAILGILLATALPSFRDMMERSRARGAANGFFADVNFTKAEAIKRAVPVKIVITGGPQWRYCITTVDCADGVLKSVAGADFPGTTLTSTRALPLAISVSPLRGTTSQTSTITFQSGQASSSVVISSMGRIRLK